MKKINFTKAFVVLWAVCLIAPAALAQRGTTELIADGWVLWDYPSIPTTEQPDTVTTLDYAWNTAGDGVIQGDQALYLGEQARAWYRFADTPVYGKLSFLLYDKGASFVHAHSSYGPRWGVMNNPAPNSIPSGGTPNDQYMGAAMTAKSFMDANLTYAFNASFSNAGTTISAQFSVAWPGSFDGSGNGQHAARQVAGTLPEDVQTYDPNDNVQGAWALWSFEVHDGQDMVFTLSEPDGSNALDWTVIPEVDSVFDTGFSTTGFNQVFFYGGNISGFGTADHVGLWVDDVQFVADPGQGVSDWAENFDAGVVVDPCADNGALGDFNCDGEVGLLDLDILGQNWGATGLVAPPATYTLGDANGDGEVGLLDLDILGQNWGTTGIVPEPATLGLLAIGGLMAIRRR